MARKGSVNLESSRGFNDPIGLVLTCFAALLLAALRSYHPRDVSANATGQLAYVHWWGGKGRTGTVVARYLARHGLAVGPAALKRLKELAKAGPYDFGDVPQRPEQCAFVRNWGQGQ